MEKFKFVYLGEYEGVYPVIVNSEVVTKNLSGTDCRIVIGTDVNDGQLFLAHTEPRAAGESPNSEDYDFSSQYVDLGNKSNYKLIAASLRSLADELEKTLNATKS